MVNKRPTPKEVKERKKEVDKEIEAFIKKYNLGIIDDGEQIQGESFKDFKKSSK